MSVQIETAKVFRTSHGRRYLTKRAAYKADIMFRLRKRHEMEGCSDWPDGRQDTFYTDRQMEHFRRVVARYWRMFGALTRATARNFDCCKKAGKA